MDGLPVTIRLLDPPLHEFLPKERGPQEALAEGGPCRASSRASAGSPQLHEANPMLGLRGCRLGIIYPRDLRDAGPAIFEAAVRDWRRWRDGDPGVMIPLVGMARELEAPEGPGRRGGTEVTKERAASCSISSAP